MEHIYILLLSEKGHWYCHNAANATLTLVAETLTEFVRLGLWRVPGLRSVIRNQLRMRAEIPPVTRRNPPPRDLEVVNGAPLPRYIYATRGDVGPYPPISTSPLLPNTRPLLTRNTQRVWETVCSQMAGELWIKDVAKVCEEHRGTALELLANTLTRVRVEIQPAGLIYKDAMHVMRLLRGRLGSHVQYAGRWTPVAKFDTKGHPKPQVPNDGTVGWIIVTEASTFIGVWEKSTRHQYLASSLEDLFDYGLANMWRMHTLTAPGANFPGESPCSHIHAMHYYSATR